MLLVFSPICGLTEQSSGQEVLFGQTRLAVTSVETIAPQTVKAEVFGETFLATPTTIGRAVATRYINNFRLSPETITPHLLGIIQQASEQQDEALTRRALTLSVQDGERDEFQTVVWWQAALTNVFAQKILSRILEGTPSVGAQKKCSILAAWHRVGASADAPDFIVGVGTECLTKLKGQLVRVFDMQLSLQQLREETIEQEELFRPFAPAAPVARSQMQLVTDLETALQQADWKQYQKVLQRVHSYDTIFVSSAAVFFLSHLANTEKGVLALSALPYILESARTPHVHTSVIAIIRALAPKDIRMLASPEIFKALTSIGRKDDELRHVLAGYLCAVFTTVREQAVLGEAARLAKMCVDSSMITGQEARRVTACIVDSATINGETNQINQIVKDWSPYTSRWERIRLQLSKIGVRRVDWLLYVLLGALVVILWKRRSRNKEDAPSESSDDIAIEQEASPLSDAEQQSLREGLAFFGLEAGASEREVKNAYRLAVKQYHPDSGYAREDGNEQFIAITQQYEQLLKLLEKMAKQ
jgi:DnaJ-domain-containing protein 1